MMKVLSYKSKELLPGILLDRESGEFKIFGKSCPVDAFEFYNPIFIWLDEYLLNPLKSTVLDLKLSYFNTVSAKFLLRIMTKMEKLSSLGNDVKIRWFYNEDDDEMEEAGEEFENILKVNFELISFKDETNETENDDYFNDMMDDIM
ncbi:MAG: DUF1987 domain-containing protein [Bacteroidales bacterium]|nr:DUF1987 domain-containing protein [Bacteroidales bacterium]